MKTSILIADGVKQVMFTPENEHEKEVLSLILPDDDVHLVTKSGSFSSIRADRQVLGVDVVECQGEYMRAYEEDSSVMFVLTPKKAKSK